MQIRWFHVHQFRSIIDGKFTLGPYSLLIGKNNAGKSNVVDALRAFYEKDSFKYKRDRDWPHAGAVDDESWIEIEFRLEGDEYNSLPEQYQWQPNTLKVRKYFHASSEGRASGDVYGYTDASQLSPTSFFGAQGVGKGKLGNVIYVPAVSSVEDHTKLTGPSALRDLIQGTLNSIAEGSGAWAKLTEDFTKASESLKTEQGDTGVSLARIEKELCGELRGWGSDFALEVVPPTADVLLKNLVRYSIVDAFTKRETAPDRLGSGFQRHLIYSLIRVQARLLAPKAKPAKKKEFSPSFTLMLFEEPEAFLHPAQQRVLAHDLRKLSGGAESHQVLCSSHSSHFVSNHLGDLCSIARLQKHGSETRAHQVSAAQLKEMSEESAGLLALLAASTGQSSADSAESAPDPADEAIFYFLQLDPRRASMFYCDHVVLVEGATDRAVLEWLRDQGKLNIGGKTVEIVDALGKWNVHRFMLLCNAMGIEHSVVIDEDAPSKPKHRALNRYIQELGTRCQTTKVSLLADDLEHFLGISLGGEDWRKPLKALKALKSNTVSEDKQKALAAIASAGIGVPG